MRAILAVLIALTPVLLVAGIAAFGGHVSLPNAAWAVVCTVLLLGFAAHRRNIWERDRADG